MRNTRIPTGTFCLAIISSALGATVSETRAAVSITNLGTLGGSSVGASVNASGQVSGFSNTTSDPFGPQHAVIFSNAPGGLPMDLGTLGGTKSYGSSINASGQVAGQSHLEGDQTSHAFLYSQSRGMVDLGSLGGASSGAYAMNDSGQVTGYSYDASIALQAILYSGVPGNGGIMLGLGTLVGPPSSLGPSSIGYAINNSGQITGDSAAPNGEYHAFLYTGIPGNGGAMADLGTLGGQVSTGRAINAAGHVVGNSSIAGNAASHAFLYTGMPGSGGSMFDLGTLSGDNSYATSINSAGIVVGYSDIPGSTPQNPIERAFIYLGTPGGDGRMIDLDAWLDANDPIDGAKWTLGVANGISDAGLITGGGYYDDGVTSGYRAFLLDASSLIPEPSSVGVSIFACGLARVRRGRQRPAQDSERIFWNCC